MTALTPTQLETLEATWLANGIEDGEARLDDAGRAAAIERITLMAWRHEADRLDRQNLKQTLLAAYRRGVEIGWRRRSK